MNTQLNAELHFLIFLVLHFCFLRSNTACYKKSDGMSHGELRGLSSAQIAILHRT